MLSQILRFVAFAICFGGCSSTKKPWDTETSIYFYKPDQEACSLAKSSNNTDDTIKCVLGVPYDEIYLRRDFEKCKDKYRLKGMSFDNFDPNNRKLIKCMTSLGWGLQSATGDNFGRNNVVLPPN